MRPPPSVCSFTSAGTSTNKRTNEHWSAQRRQLDAGASSNYFAELPLLTLVRVQTLAVVCFPKTLRAFIAPSPSPSLCFSFSFLFSLLLLPQVCTYVCVCVLSVYPFVMNSTSETCKASYAHLLVAPNALLLHRAL